MSTADSQLLAASSSASQNILKEVFMKDMSEKTGMLIARITVLIIALIGVFIARDPNSSVSVSYTHLVRNSGGCGSGL